MGKIVINSCEAVAPELYAENPRKSSHSFLAFEWLLDEATNEHTIPDEDKQALDAMSNAVLMRMISYKARLDKDEVI